MENIKIVVGHVNFTTIKVRNRNKFNWANGCYLAPIEKIDKDETYVIEAVPIMQVVSGNSDAEVLVPIEVKFNAKPLPEQKVIQMSFFDSKGNPFGEKFALKFSIVSESHKFLEEIDTEIYKLALKLRE